MLRLLIVMFLLESTWAVAAQYCEHELGLDSVHFGHHQHEHKAGDASSPGDQTLIKADSQNAPSNDNDCPYCHLGAMKSILTVPVKPLATPSPSFPTEVILIYPHIVLRQPERPNWRLAA